MKIKTFTAIILAAIVATGCNKNGIQPTQSRAEKLASQQQWMANYNKQDKDARNAALSKVSNRDHAVQMELAADKATYDKMVQVSHHPYPGMDQRIQQSRDILTKAEQAKADTRASAYKTKFRPIW